MTASSHFQTRTLMSKPLCLSMNPGVKLKVQDPQKRWLSNSEMKLLSWKAIYNLSGLLPCRQLHGLCLVPTLNPKS